jgi:hypothetical protein
VQFTQQVVQTLRTMFIRKENLSLPVSVRRESPRIEDKAQNSATLQVRHSLSQRTILRLGVEVLTKYRGKSVYRRLKMSACYLSIPTPEQAELAIEAILTFAQSLDGKWLAPSESAQTTEPAVLREQEANQQAIRTESAEDSQDSSQVPATGAELHTQDDDVTGFSGS